MAAAVAAHAVRRRKFWRHPAPSHRRACSPKAEHAAVEGPHGGALLQRPRVRGAARLIALSRALLWSDGVVYFPHGGDAAGSEEGLGRPPDL
jgi:hypothetical protein